MFCRKDSQEARKTYPFLSLLMLCAAASALSTANSHAGSCHLPNGCMRAIVEASLAARASVGLSAPQSVAAMMHHQPTVCSVAAAEERLAAVADGIRRARGRRCGP